MHGLSFKDRRAHTLAEECVQLFPHCGVAALIQIIQLDPRRLRVLPPELLLRTQQTLLHPVQVTGKRRKCLPICLFPRFKNNRHIIDRKCHSLPLSRG